MLWWALGMCFTLAFAWVAGVFISVVFADRPDQVAWVQDEGAERAELTADLVWRKRVTGWRVRVIAVIDGDGYHRRGLRHQWVFELHADGRVPYLAVQRLSRNLRAVTWRA